ncbi:MAG: MBL fold metallo-hydrolase [Candidatus Nanohaloarchaea archaeon]|nr:MBL fold metallo-hydrolase [Candidatus Nanohaloarchaea archaeon]
MDLTFLGTGGGRFTMIEQLRNTGGMYLEEGGFSLYIDPAPGALVRAREEGVPLEELDAIMVTHAHLDHCGDMHAIIEAMTEGGDREEGKLFASESVLDGAEIPAKYSEGEGTYGEKVPPALDSYHEGLVPEIVRLRDGDESELGPFRLRCLETEHSDPRTVAFTLGVDGREYGFVTDTEMFDRLPGFFADSDVLVVNLMRPHDREWKGHLNTEDAAELLNETEPEFAVMQHFGAAMIYGSVQDERKWLEEETDVDFVMAEDGMEIDLEDPRKGLQNFLH